MSLGIRILSDVRAFRGIITGGREGFYIKSPGVATGLPIPCIHNLTCAQDGPGSRELVKSRFDYSYEISQYIQLYRKMLPFRPE